MIMIRAIIRPEKSAEVMQALMDAGQSAVTEMDVYGRGKQKGIKIGNVFYDEIPKTMLMLVVKDSEEDKIVDVIMEAARTGDNGNYGDGRIFVSTVDAAYTISSKSEGL